VNVGDYGDVLEYTGEGGGATVYSFASCANAFQAFSTFHGTTTSPSYGADWLPSGWTGVYATGNDDHLICHELPDSHSLSIRDSNDANSNTRWRELLLSFMSSMLTGWYSHGIAADDDVMTLYGTQLTTALPTSLYLTSSDRTSSKDVLTFRTTTGTAAYSVFRRGDACDAAVTAVAPAQATRGGQATATGWTDYTLSGVQMNAHCYAGSVTVVVLAPTADALQAAGGWSTTTTLLTEISAELTPAPVLGEVQTLPISQWKVAVPSGWTVGTYDPGSYDDWDDWDEEEYGDSEPKTDLLEVGSGGPRIYRPVGTCDQALSGGVYDPSWMPDGWKAVTTYSSIRYCATVEGGPIQVEVSTYAAGLNRLALIAILDSLRYQNTPQPVYTPDTTTPYVDPAVVTPDAPDPTPYVPSHASKRILPWPIDLSLQSIKIGSDRGWGARIGLGLNRFLSERISFGLRGEVGYDSVSALSYDAAANLDLRLTSGLTAIGYVGRDQLGTGDGNTIAGAFYYGVGGSWGMYERDGGFYLEVDYDKRTGGDEMMPDPMYPDHEWRFQGAIYWDGKGRVNGLSTEYRTAGDSGTFLLGVKLRL
jgi:hypothetical protein